MRIWWGKNFASPRLGSAKHLLVVDLRIETIGREGSMKPFTLIAAVIFGLMALLHAYRLVTHFQVIVGSQTIAQELSWIGVIVTAVLSVGLFREARR
jgi:hypothetical protein